MWSFQKVVKRIRQKKNASWEKKNIIIIDNCSSHYEVYRQSSKTIFFTWNTTPNLQKCDQGVIRCLKSYYRKEVVGQATNCFHEGIPFDINLLEALTYGKYMESCSSNNNSKLFLSCLLCYFRFMAGRKGMPFEWDWEYCNRCSKNEGFFLPT